MGNAWNKQQCFTPSIFFTHITRGLSSSSHSWVPTREPLFLAFSYHRRIILSIRHRRCSSLIGLYPVAWMHSEAAVENDHTTNVRYLWSAWGMAFIGTATSRDKIETFHNCHIWYPYWLQQLQVSMYNSKSLSHLSVIDHPILIVKYIGT